AATFEIWGALLNGARLVIVPQSVLLDAERIVQLIEHEHVTVLWMTVGLLTHHVDLIKSVFPQLRYLITGGDVVDPALVRGILARDPPLNFLNGYGPTECTTFSTTYRVSVIDAQRKNVSIGKPISNTTVYILDRGLQPLSIGGIGEIYIGGDGV